MTRAATPAVRGADSLVPPPRLRPFVDPGAGVQSGNRGDGVQMIHPSQPGATASTVRPVCATPAPERLLMASFRHGCGTKKVPDWTSSRSVCVAPSVSTPGDDPGDESVLPSPESPVSCTTVAPARTAAAFASAHGSSGASG